MKFFTLLTDFGLKDSYVAEMKGVIYSLVKDAVIVDISHSVEPQNIEGASFLLECSYRYFPPNTVHTVVVDPGVGSDRRILLIVTVNYVFIGPDNGVLERAAEDDGIVKVYSVDSLKLREEILKLGNLSDAIKYLFNLKVSSTFHGRDIFVPLACYWQSGGDISLIGERVDNIISIQGSSPVVKENKIYGRVIFIDHFGNLITNIKPELLSGKCEVFIEGKNGTARVGKLAKTYSDVGVGEPVALVSSRNRLEIGVNMGNASSYFKAGINSRVTVLL